MWYRHQPLVWFSPVVQEQQLEKQPHLQDVKRPAAAPGGQLLPLAKTSDCAKPPPSLGLLDILQLAAAEPNLGKTGSPNSKGRKSLKTYGVGAPATSAAPITRFVDQQSWDPVHSLPFGGTLT